MMPKTLCKFKANAATLYLEGRDRTNPEIICWSGIIDMLAGNVGFAPIEVPLVSEEKRSDGSLWVTLDLSEQEIEFNDVKVHDMTVESKLVDIIRPSTYGGDDVGIRFSCK